MKEIKDLNKRKNTLCSWNEQLSTIKMSILYILIYTFITVKIPTSNFFVCFEMAVYWIYLPARYHVHPFAVYTVFSRINRLYLTHLLKGSVSNNVTHKSLCLPKGNVVSPLHINLEITNFQRCKHATYYQDITGPFFSREQIKLNPSRNQNLRLQSQLWVKLQVCLHLLLTILQLYCIPPPLPPPVSNFLLAFWLHASCCTTVLFKVLYYKVKNVFFFFF